MILLGEDTKQISLSFIVDIKGYTDGIGLMHSSGKDIILKFNNESTDNIKSFYIILGRILYSSRISRLNGKKWRKRNKFRKRLLHFCFV